MKKMVEQLYCDSCNIQLLDEKFFEVEEPCAENPHFCFDCLIDQISGNPEGTKITVIMRGV